MIQAGDTWNESECFPDALTGRRVRRLTTQGWLNQTPTYHTNSTFTQDSRYIVFVSVRDQRSYLIRAECETGELLALWETEGVGDRSYVHRGMALAGPGVDGRGLAGNRVCMAPRSGLAILAHGRRVLSVDIHTSEERVLLEDCGPEWIFGAPCVSPDEKHVAVALSSAHPQLTGRQPVTTGYTDYPDHTLRLVRIPMDSIGAPELLYEHQPAQSAHCAFCPVDDNLLYFDLDVPPQYWNGNDGHTPRIRLLDCASGKERPLKEEYPGPFQVHQAWLWDGSAIAYHGPLVHGGVFVGITGTDGVTVWEREFPSARFYGHLTPDPTRKALILDGDFSADMLQWLSYDDTGQAAPALQPICRHGTEWESIPGQYSHPHPNVDPRGMWLCYNVAAGGRSDVCCVGLGERNTPQ